MDDEANTSEEQANPDERAPLTIKAFPVSARKLATACASRRGEIMGDWFARAVHTQAAIEAGDRLTPPGLLGRRSGEPDPEPDRLLSESSVTVAIRFLNDVCAAHVAAGAPVPPGLLREARLTAAAMLREMRGVAPRRRAAIIGSVGLPGNGVGLPDGQYGLPRGARFLARAEND